MRKVPVKVLSNCKRLHLLILAFLLMVAVGCGPSPWDEPPLHDAAKSGDLEEVIELLDQGISVHSKNSEGATPLHWAAFKGHVDVARELLKRGANVNALTKKGSTPLRLATTHKQTDMIKFLKSRGGREQI